MAGLPTMLTFLFGRHAVGDANIVHHMRNLPAHVRGASTESELRNFLSETGAQGAGIGADGIAMGTSLDKAA